MTNVKNWFFFPKGKRKVEISDRQKDREVVLVAVRQDGFALKFASKELKNDKEIVLVAVRNDSDALDYASD